MPLPKDIKFVTFDVYGTLIDWEDGAYQAFSKEAEKDGFSFSKDELVTLFLQHQRDVMGGSYELYAEVLRRTALAVAKDLGWALEPNRAQFLPDSIPRWKPFKETLPALKKVVKAKNAGLVSNIDDKLLGQSRRYFGIDFELVVTAQQVRSYKPDPAHFKECERRIGQKKGWVHIASSHYHDIDPCAKLKVPTIWVNRRGEELEAGAKKPTEEVSNLKEALKLLGL